MSKNNYLQSSLIKIFLLGQIKPSEKSHSWIFIKNKVAKKKWKSRTWRLKKKNRIGLQGCIGQF